MLDRLEYGGASARVHVIRFVCHGLLHVCQTLSVRRERSRAYLIVLAVDDTFLSREAGAVTSESNEIRTLHL